MASAPCPSQRIPVRFMRCWTTWLIALSTAPLPIEMFGGSLFPRIGELPYMLTLGPYSFYWFRLRWL